MPIDEVYAANACGDAVFAQEDDTARTPKPLHVRKDNTHPESSPSSSPDRRREPRGAAHVFVTPGPVSKFWQPGTYSRVLVAD